MRVVERYVFYGNETDHARCPWLTRLADGRLILGINILHNHRKLRYDWDHRQKPHYILGRTPQELAARQPRLLSDSHGLPPMFFERRDGAILAAYNSWQEYPLGSEQADTILRDKELTPFVRTHQDHALIAAGAKHSGTYEQRLQLIGWDPGEEEAGKPEALGLLQPITVLRSTDGGESWEPWSRIHFDPERQKGGAAFRGNMLELDNGEILFMNSSFVNSDAEDARDKWAARLLSSTDGGRTWHIKSRLIVQDDPAENISESHIYRQSAGRLSVVSRTTGHGALAIAHSADNGRTWSEGPRMTTCSGYPPHVLAHSSGKTLLTYYRRGIEPMGLKAKLLEPDLSDIDDAAEHVLLERKGKGMGGGGYPSAVELDDGTILISIYDRLEPYGPYQIVGVRIEL